MVAFKDEHGHAVGNRSHIATDRDALAAQYLAAQCARCRRLAGASDDVALAAHEVVGRGDEPEGLGIGVAGGVGRFATLLTATGAVVETERDGSVTVLRNVLDRGVEIVGIVGVFVVELRRRGGRLAECVYRSVGEGVVGSTFRGVVFRTFMGGILIVVVCRYPGHALVGGVVVGLVVRPRGRTIVHVEYEESLARQSGIPPLLLPVFKEKILVAVALVVDDVAVATILQGCHVRDALRFIKSDGRLPTGHPSLVAGISGGLITVTIVGTTVHEVPFEHTLTTAVVRIVEVGIAEAMTELVAHRTDAGNFIRTVQFAAAGIGVNLHAVKRLTSCAVAIVVGRGECPLVRPDGLRTATVGFALSGIDHVHLLHFAVAVPIVVPIVYLRVGQLQGLDDHSGWVSVIVIARVRTIVATSLAYGDWTHDVEGQLKLSAALRLEVIVHRPFEVAGREILLVGNALIEGLVVGSLEGHIAEVHQDDESLLLAGYAPHRTNAPRQAVGTTLVGLRTAHGGMPLDEVGINNFVEVCARNEAIGLAVGTGPIVTMLIADKRRHDCRSVSERQRLCLSRLRGHGKEARRKGKPHCQDRQSQDFKIVLHIVE